MNPIPSHAVAVIGIAANLPGCGDELGLLMQLLDKAADMVAPVSEQRRRDAGYAPEQALSEAALLARIDEFDYRYFGLSLREARQMDPQQRMLLQLACKAIWDAGYACEGLRASRTAVVFAAAQQDYAELLINEESPLITGLIGAAQAGRVAYELDLRGPAYTVDTACSSGLAAILDAARLVAAGEVDLALTGGVRLLSRPAPAIVPGKEGILSASGRARSFDAAADGTAFGEGGVVYLLKNLEQAQRDGDHIYALIRGGARNQDGGRSNGFAAPSAEAQQELLREAWRNAGVTADSIGFVEAHGTGTRLGDPIEFRALTKAFGEQTERRHFCVLSSIKSNIGHLDNAAGAAGMLKALLTLRAPTRWASAHFARPNPLLEVDDSALRLSPVPLPWPDGAPRVAGVSAFGLTGTNVHLVLGEAPCREDRSQLAQDEDRLLLLAARSELGLRRHARRLAEHLKEADVHGFADAAWVQTAGRDHGPVRASVRARSSVEAADALAHLAAGGSGAVELRPGQAVLLLPHEGSLSGDMLEGLLAHSQALQRGYQADLKQVQGLDQTLQAVANDLLNKLWMLHGLIALGLPQDRVIGHGSGNLVIDLLRGEISLPQAARAASALRVAAPEPARLAEALEAFATQGRAVYVLPWAGMLADAVSKLAAPGDCVVLTAGAGLGRVGALELLAALYKAGLDLSWNAVAELCSPGGRRASVPTALFEDARCWPDVRLAAPVGASAEAVPNEAPVEAPVVVDANLLEAESSAAEQALAAIWRRLLGCGALSRDDDFFELGGDSLMQTQLTNAVQQRFGVELDHYAVYDHSTLAALAAHIDSLQPRSSALEGPQHDAQRRSAPATRSQRRMWLLQQLEPKSGAYNVVIAYRFNGGVDSAALRQALLKLAGRHDILRSSFVLEAGELCMRVHETIDLEFDCRELSDWDASLLHDGASRPFDLSHPGAWRVQLLSPSAASGSSRQPVLQLVMHHAICDEWSMRMLLQELAQDYRAISAGQPSPLPSPKLGFADWAAWEHSLESSPTHARDAQYWLQSLRGAPSSLAIPTDFAYGAQQSHEGAWLRLSLPAELTGRMREAARAANGSLFTWLFTAYAAWLARLTQMEDFVVGVPTAGRHHPDAEHIPGCFINTLPIRIDASGAPGFAELFGRIQAALTEALNHQRYPFDLMLEQLGIERSAARPPLVQTLMSLQGGGPGAKDGFSLGEALGTPMALEGNVAWFDLSAVLWEEQDGSLAGVFAYRKALFEPETVQSFWDDWKALLQAGLEQPDVPIHELFQESAW